MSKRTIVSMPGDGIGKVVLDEAIRVLDAAGFEANYVEGDIGWEFWRSEGNPLPQRTLDLIAEHKIGLFIGCKNSFFKINCISFLHSSIFVLCIYPNYPY